MHRKRLTFNYASPMNRNQRVAVSEETGLHFVITHLTDRFPDAEYEVEISERGGKTRTEYVHRLDTARALCERKVENRLTGADQ